MDTISKDQRSKLMAKIRSKGARSTEARFRASLVSNGLHGWKMNSDEVIGCPDFAFPKIKLAIFIDGCFWHGCPSCCRMPSSNRPYWKKKIESNTKRDKKIARSLRKQGWTVIRFWEHQLRRSVKECVDVIELQTKQ